MRLTTRTKLHTVTLVVSGWRGVTLLMLLCSVVVFYKFGLEKPLKINKPRVLEKPKYSLTLSLVRKVN